MKKMSTLLADVTNFPNLTIPYKPKHSSCLVTKLYRTEIKSQVWTLSNPRAVAELIKMKRLQH